MSPNVDEHVHVLVSDSMRTAGRHCPPTTSESVGPGPPNSATFVIVVLNIVSLAVLIVVFGYLIYRCRRLD